jgi:hypothetical protein
MPWRSWLYPAVIIGVAALLIEATEEPWQTGLTAGVAVLVSLWLWDMTRGGH